jgi:hypothetical protein
MRKASEEGQGPSGAVKPVVVVVVVVVVMMMIVVEVFTVQEC